MDLYTPLINDYIEKGLLLACTTCLENYSDAIRLAAEAYHIPFIRRYDLYNGANHDEDAVVKGFIMDDGAHPSNLGAQQIAEQLSQVGYEPISPP
jgi:lysophospholipase L1-like esterase